MPYRPEWYQNDDRRQGMGQWFGNLSAVGLILVVTFGAFLVQVLLAKASGGDDVLGNWLGLRAWWPGEFGVMTLSPRGAPTVDQGPLPDPNQLVFNWIFPVQLVGYMLVHSTASLWHVGGNMLYLFIFGRELEATLGRTGFLRLYLTGGIVGGIACWVSALLGGNAVPVVGASGAVYAVMILYAFKWPRRTILLFPIPLPIPIWLLAAFRVFQDLNGLLVGAMGVAFLAHLGGAAVGFLWHKRGDVVMQADMARRRVRAEKRSEQESGERREMDRILGKIQSEGLGALSAKEREFLNRRSKQLRERGR